MSLVRDLLLSLSDFYLVRPSPPSPCRSRVVRASRADGPPSLPDVFRTQSLDGPAKQAYAAFALDVVQRLKDRSGAWLTERAVRELAYWNAVADGVRAAEAAGTAAGDPAAGAAPVEGASVGGDGLREAGMA